MDKIHGNYLNQLNPDFPLDCETLQYIQHNEMMCEVLGNIAGDKVILMGCTLNQEETERAEGYVFIRTVDYPNGEILSFGGGAVANGFHLEKTDINVSAGAVTYNKAYTQRRLVAGSDNSEGAENFTWDEFVELTTTKDLHNAIAEVNHRLDNIVEEPIGFIKMWAGADLPNGYLYCDGANLQIPSSESDTYWKLWQAIRTTFNIAGDVPTPDGYFALPNLSGRFIVGKGQAVGDNHSFTFKETGGASKVQLTESNLPSHKHNFVSDINSTNANPQANITKVQDFNDASGEGQGIGAIFETSPVGGGVAHENLPPYFTLAYIIRYQ
jgi:microcystin-dependent protein